MGFDIDFHAFFYLDQSWIPCVGVRSLTCLQLTLRESIGSMNQLSARPDNGTMGIIEAAIWDDTDTLLSR